MRTVAIVQARMGSSRLPGKVLMDLCGAPILARVLERLGRADVLDGIMVATTTEAHDDAIERLARSSGAEVFRGPEQDVLARYAGAAIEARAEVVVRITADCPLIDPGVVSRVVRAANRQVDFASNAITRTFPRGLDTEVMHTDVLARVDRMAMSPQAREHVCWFIYREALSLFAIREVKDVEDNSEVSWTVDTAADLDRLRRIWADVDYRELLARGGR